MRIGSILSLPATRFCSSASPGSARAAAFTLPSTAAAASAVSPSATTATGGDDAMMLPVDGAEVCGEQDRAGHEVVVDYSGRGG